MRIAVIGCGGIGGTIAACLTRAGLDVTPVTGSAAVVTALARHGLRVRELDGATWTVQPANPPRVSAADADAGAPFDVLVMATQNPALEGALRSAVPRLAEGGVVVCCENGLPEERAAAIVGARRVVGCVVGWGATAVEPGFYQRTSRGTLQLGRLSPEAPDPAAGDRISIGSLAVLMGAASESRVVDDLPAVRWSKLAINCATSTIGACGGDALGTLLRHRFVRRLALEVFAEVADVAGAESVRVAPVAGTFAIEKIAISRAERLQRLGSPSLAYKHSLLLAVGMKYRRQRSSMLYALERGRPPEIDFLNGEVVRRGERLGVPTPVNAALVRAVRAIAAGRARSSLATLRAIHTAAVGGQPGELAAVG